MPDTMRRGRDARDTGANDGDFRPSQRLPSTIGTRRCGRQDQIYEPLEDLEDEEERVEDGVWKPREERHHVRLTR